MERVNAVRVLPIGRTQIARINELFRGAVNNLPHFVKIPERFLKVEKIEIISPGGLEVDFSSGKRIVKGIHVVSRNIYNPNPLHITIEKGSLIMDPMRQSNLFLRGEGVIFINAGMNRDQTKEKEQTSRQLFSFRVPDLTNVDGMEFPKIGPVAVKITQGALIIIKPNI